MPWGRWPEPRDRSPARDPDRSRSSSRKAFSTSTTVSSAPETQNVRHVPESQTPSGKCPPERSLTHHALSELAARSRASPGRPSTEPELTPSAPGQPGAIFHTNAERTAAAAAAAKPIISITSIPSIALPSPATVSGDFSQTAHFRYSPESPARVRHVWIDNARNTAARTTQKGQIVAIGEGKAPAAEKRRL